MKKTVWILNHYATAMYFDKGGRHYSLAKYLLSKGYKPIILCSNIRHNSTDEIEIEKGVAVKRVVDHIPFIFVKTCKYGNSKKKRLISMFQYYFDVLRIADALPRPDVIIGSSVHPLACIAANQLSKRFHCKSICEIRDLWPESIAAYGILNRKNPLMRLLYQGEKWIYKKADEIVMTWPGGYDYIKHQKWDKQIPESKVTHISNGVDIKKFWENAKTYTLEDKDLKRKDRVKFVYTGSIRAVNNLKILVDAAELLQKGGENRILILIWGDGDEREKLEKLVQGRGLQNIVFKGNVPKSYIPSILSQADISILHNTSTELDIYGQSQNKFFEYLAAGHPILMTYTVGHSVVEEKQCGIEIEKQSPEEIAKAMELLSKLSKEEYQDYCIRAQNAVKEYDFAALGDKLIQVIENTR